MQWLRIFLCATLPFTFHLSPFTSLQAQHPVAPVTDWLATVDETTQQIMLRWRPSADSATMGYHICTGSPCLDYDTVFGWLDTTYICADHSPLERHTYKLHVFDSSYDVSSLTPPFGNMVLSADIPECATAVSTSWTPYQGMPDGVGRYTLMVRQEPFEDSFEEYYTTDSAGTQAYNFDMADGATRVHVKVLAYNRRGNLVSQSNVVSVERRTVDSAAFVEIVSVDYDTLTSTVKLSLHTDTAFHTDRYTLWRSIDGSPWRELAVINPHQPYFTYTDDDLRRNDSLHCYQLSVADACGMNEKYSATRCVAVPDPPEPGVLCPNGIIVGDDRNGTFLPWLRGWDGETYELTIYNRLGMQIYTTSDPRQGWRPNTEIPQGGYAYVLHVGFRKGVKKTYTGTIIVIK